jgi:hypothetical protein
LVVELGHNDYFCLGGQMDGCWEVVLRSIRSLYSISSQQYG